jgi:hypothetical protein
VLLVLLPLSAHFAAAKRGAPDTVPPVLFKGVTYSAPNKNGMINYVLASDLSGKELFRIKVFDMPIDPKLEEDAQWIFITHLELSGDSLLVKDEKGRCFAINLTTRAVKRKYWCLF